MAETVRVRCPACGAQNRVPLTRWGQVGAKCGRCRSPLLLYGLFPEEPIPASDVTFEQEVLGFPGPVLVEFFALWCGHSKRMAPTITELASVYAGRVKFVRVNVDESPRSASAYRVDGTPTLVFISRGDLVDRLVGEQPRSEVTRRLDMLIGR
jgi:thioredoxin